MGYLTTILNIRVLKMLRREKQEKETTIKQVKMGPTFNGLFRRDATIAHFQY